MLKQSSGIFSNFGADKPPLRQAAGTLAVSFPKQTLKLKNDEKHNHIININTI